MSRRSRFAFVPTIWIRHPELSTTDKAVLTALATYASEDRYSYPSVRTIAEDVQLSERSVQYALRTLEEIGALKVERRTDSEGRHTSNGYWLLGYDLMQVGVQPIAPSGVQPIAPGRVQPIAPKQYQYEQDQCEEASTPTPTTAALKFSNDAMQDAYLLHRSTSRSPSAFDASLNAILNGMTTGKVVSPDVLGLALMDMAANGEGFNASRIRGYIRKHESVAAFRADGKTSVGGVDWDQITREMEAEYAAKERSA